MSDLAATNCGGCTQTTTSGGCNCMWIILILLFCGGWNNNDGCGCGGGNGFFNNGNSCGPHIKEGHHGKRTRQAV